jgi:hypothetical protein
MKVEIDIHRISDELYDLLLKEFRKQFGEGYYDEWIITAEKQDMNEEIEDELEELKRKFEDLENERTK